MPSSPECRARPSVPVAIGGIGGSGTRVFASALQHLGYYLGDDMNRQLDNLAFTLLFKRIELFGASAEDLSPLWELFQQRSQNLTVDPDPELYRQLCRNRVGHRQSWLRERYASLATDTPPARGTGTSIWGWKEPNTHMFVEQFLRLSPQLKYIHVVRNGLDMAFSKNQNQLRLWGQCLLGSATGQTPEWSLKFWCEAHRRMLDLRNRFPDRVLLVSFEQMCEAPLNLLFLISHFIGASLPENTEDFCSEVTVPLSVGRWEHHDTRGFDKRCVQFVAEVMEAASV